MENTADPNTIAHISPVWSRSARLIAERGEGAYLYTSDGRRLLDFTCGIGVTNTGHAHPKVVEAIQAQAGQLLHGQANIVYHRPMLRLVEELLTILPTPLNSFFFSNSGAEILEAAIKLAKQATKRTNVIVFSGSFHGRTHLAMSLTTSKVIYRAGHQPLVPGVFIAPYPYAYRSGWDEEATIEYCLRELDDLFTSQTAPPETAAILIEPVLGEGGYVPAPARFMQALREICDQHGILLIADEVQSGFGRTGKWFAVEHSQVVPDILTMAKGIASGLPLSALAAPDDLMKKWPPGSHGGTFGGNAVACAAAVATIQAIRAEGLIDNAARMGTMLVKGLKDIQAIHPEIGDVRGVGLMVATEFVAQVNDRRQPDGKRTKAITKAALERGLMLLTCGPHDNVIRWIPPLIVTASQVQDALDRFACALNDIQD